jgi:hypothetical protein
MGANRPGDDFSAMTVPDCQMAGACQLGNGEIAAPVLIGKPVRHRYPAIDCFGGKQAGKTILPSFSSLLASR